MHRWVAERKGKVGFSVQVFALPEDKEPTRHTITAGLRAEAVGLDAFFIGDHPGYATEPWVHLAAIAAQTSRIGLGSVVNCVEHRHPAMLARLAGDLDHISNGRLILGLGIGWNVPEFKQLGLDFTSIKARQESLEEAIQIVNGMFGPEPFTFHGNRWWTEGGHYQVGAVQQPRPPLMIAGSGETVTLRQVAQYADICNFGPGTNTGKVRDADDVRHKCEVLRAHCERLERPYEDILRSHFTSWAMIAPTTAEAEAKRDLYYPNGMTDEQKITRWVGSPVEIAARYQALVDAGIEYFVVQVLDAQDLETIELLASEVMPRVKPLA